MPSRRASTSRSFSRIVDWHTAVQLADKHLCRVALGLCCKRPATERCFNKADPERSPSQRRAARAEHFFDDPRALRLVDVGKWIVMRRAWACIRFVGYAATVSSSFSALVLAQTNPQPKSDAKSPPPTSRAADSEQRPVAVFKAHTDLVLIPVTVTDTLLANDWSNEAMVTEMG